MYFERSERAFFKKKKRFVVHVIPQFHENKTQFYPKPYVYHPELWPERAVNNPEPQQWIEKEIPTHHRVINEDKKKKKEINHFLAY